MRERRNDPEIMKNRAIACGIQLGSISSLRCQKSRSSHPVGSRCKAMFRGRSDWPCFFQQAIVSIKPSGGARRDRTDDLMLAKHALSQLSYGPVTRRRMPHVRSSYCARLRKALRRSSLRSRRPAEPKLQSSEGWWAWEDLNFRPHAYQARALTN